MSKAAAKVYLHYHKYSVRCCNHSVCFEFGMLNKMAEFEVFLQGGSPWGFRLQGGKEFRIPLRISRVSICQYLSFLLIMNLRDNPP